MLQVAVIGALLALTVFVVLSDTSSDTPRGSSGPKTGPSGPSGTRAGTDVLDRSSALLPLPPEPHAELPPAATPLSVAPPAPMPDIAAAAGGSTVAGSLQVALKGATPKQGFLQPDPDRLIQTEVLEPVGSIVRAGAAIRLVFWIVLAGVGVGLVILGAVRGIALFFENLLGV